MAVVQGRVESSRLCATSDLSSDPKVLVLRLRDSVVRLGEELEQSAQAEARERENARYYQQRLQDTRLEMEDLVQREQEGGRRRMELVTARTANGQNH